MTKRRAWLNTPVQVLLTCLHPWWEGLPVHQQSQVTACAALWWSACVEPVLTGDFLPIPMPPPLHSSVWKSIAVLISCHGNGLSFMTVQMSAFVWRNDNIPVCLQIIAQKHYSSNFLTMSIVPDTLSSICQGPTVFLIPTIQVVIFLRQMAQQSFTIGYRRRWQL